MVFAESWKLTADSYFHIKRRILYFQAVEILHSVQDDMKTRFFNSLPAQSPFKTALLSGAAGFSRRRPGPDAGAAISPENLIYLGAVLG